MFPKFPPRFQKFLTENICYTFGKNNLHKANPNNYFIKLINLKDRQKIY